jgi:enoyl-CoA hydratase
MSTVLFDVDGVVCTIKIDNPKRRNAVDGVTARALKEAFLRFEADADLRVAVLTGAGDCFCAGADLTSLDDPKRQHEFRADGGGTGPMGPSRLALNKPLIAAIEGYAVAGGLELALLADLRVAADNAVLGVFCRRWGVPLIDGGTVRLPRVVGMGHAMDMILTGRPVGAQEARSMGLVNRVTAAGQALLSAQSLARQVASFPQQCMLADRHSAYAQWGMSVGDALRYEGKNGLPALHAEGVGGARQFAGGAGRHGQFAD